MADRLCDPSCVPLRPLVLLGAALSASALLIDPRGGTTVFGPGTDDSTSFRSLGGTFSLYGESVDTLYLVSNGYLTTVSSTPLVLDRGVGSMAGVLGGPVIAGLFDDLRAYDGNGVRENVGRGYYAATFDMPAFGFPAAGESNVFQIALFNAEGVYGGAALQAGDIVLSYDRVGSASGTFTVGVAASRTNATPAFGGDGQFELDGFATHFDPSAQGILFRYDPASGGYAQSLVPLAPVPEPASLAALGLGVLGLLRRRKGRNRAGATNDR